MSELTFAEAQNSVSRNESNQVSAGLRRSMYGCRAQNHNDLWWAERAIAYARKLGPGVRPCIVEIVTTWDEGTAGTIAGFPRPGGFSTPAEGVSFQPSISGLDHERALSVYDSMGVDAILQFEPGNADVGLLIDLASAAFGQHPCVKGFGVDAEWYRYAESADRTGIEIADSTAQRWMEGVQKINPSYTLFLKHWLPSHMPSIRPDGLWFLSDSQQFKSLDEMMSDFADWANAFGGKTVGYQFGYPDDKVWWSSFDDPVSDLSKRIGRDIPQTRFYYWVDFTADEVSF